jgi:hypothetical protein
MAHQTRGWVAYDPTNFGGSTFAIKADNTTAANNGTTLTPNPAVQNFWPMHRSDLRCVYGKDSSNARDSCIALNPTGTLFALGSTFVDSEGNSYTTYGLRSERYRVRDLK